MFFLSELSPRLNVSFSLCRRTNKCKSRAKCVSYMQVAIEKWKYTISVDICGFHARDCRLFHPRPGERKNKRCPNNSFLAHSQGVQEWKKRPHSLSLSLGPRNSLRSLSSAQMRRGQTVKWIEQRKNKGLLKKVQTLSCISACAKCYIAKKNSGLIFLSREEQFSLFLGRYNNAVSS